MELQQLRYVVAIAEERSFTRAAQRCFVVQSALSHQVKALEQEIGTALFVRSPRRVELTPAGEAFVVEARACLAAAERAGAAAAAASGQVRGALAIGVIPTVTALDVPAAVARFHREYPLVEVTLRGGGSDAFVRDITQGHLDVAFLGFADTVTPVGVASVVLRRGSLVALLPAEHPLAAPPGAASAELSLGEIAALPFIDFPAGSPGRAQSDQAFDAAGHYRRVAFEATSIDVMVALVAEGLGVCLVPEGCFDADADPRVCVRHLSDGPRRTEHLAWDGFNPSPAASAFVQQVTGAWRQ